MAIASAGSGAAVTGLPITSAEAPAAIASRGVVIRFWSPAAAHAGLTGLWLLDEISGTTAPNIAIGGTDGTLYNGPAWVNDAQRGQVLQFDGGDDWVDAGFVPALATGDDFTWSFWSYQQQGVNNDVM